MSILVLVEHDEGKIKRSSKEAVCYGAELDKNVTALVFGTIEEQELSDLGKFGANRVLHVADERLNNGIIQAYASTLAQAMQTEGANVLVLAKSSISDSIAAKVGIKADASVATNVTELPVSNGGYRVRRSIFTGKAFVWMELTKDKKVLGIKKNAVEIKEREGSAEVASFTPNLTDDDFKVNITGRDKAKGQILLPEAEIIVSGGRGMKGPENWGMLE